MEYDNTNSGALFKNDKKKTDKHPEYTGTINVNGVEYWLSAWVKEKKGGGAKFFSLSVKPKEDRPVADNSRNLTDKVYAPTNWDDSDVPF